MYRSFLRPLILALMCAFASPAAAQFTRDNAANKKIDEAINTHYLATDFDRAESVLTGTVNACEDKCSPQTLARAWMYVGIVRGSGKSDIAGAKAAFQSALSLDPSVKLDAALATPETQAAFDQRGGAGATPMPATAPGPADTAATPAAVGNLTCTPELTEVETRRAIPVQCATDAEVTSLELRFKVFGSETWKSLKMERKGKGYRAQIPCEATQAAGVLRLYVRGKDATGDEIASFGSKAEPIELQLVEKSEQEPPSFDDADPPPRCAVREICPPDFPGCESGKSGGGTLDWGASCGNSSECKSGLLCLDGSCEAAPSCSTDTDCPVGTCKSGKCALEGGAAASGSGPARKVWVGLHVAQDIALVGGDSVCSNERQNSESFACYLPKTDDVPYDSDFFVVEPGNEGNIGTGFVPATTRILVSLDYAVTGNLMAGLRLGYALGGGPPAGKLVEYDPENYNEAASVTSPGTKFLPYHAEGRISYWFGAAPFARKGLRAYAHGGGGLAQVDARVAVKVKDKNHSGAVAEASELEAWKKLGRGFVTIGGGAMFAFTPRLGAQLNLNLMYMMTDSGIVVQPSLGVVYGF